MSWVCWGIIVLVLANVGYRYVPPQWWYVSPNKRRAMRLAMQAARQLHGVEKLVGAHCFIQRYDRNKCFVFLQHKCIIRPEPYSVFAVYLANDRVDDLGTWVFHWGLFFPAQPMDAYETCRAEGIAWPVGLQEWIEWSKERGHPM